METVTINGIDIEVCRDNQGEIHCGHIPAQKGTATLCGMYEACFRSNDDATSCPVREALKVQQ